MVSIYCTEQYSSLVDDEPLDGQLAIFGPLNKYKAKKLCAVFSRSL